MLNIPTSIQDPSYRYRMPRIMAKIEGKGNGIKTILVNLNDIADSLDRPPSMILRFMTIELGSTGKGDLESDRATLTGAFTENNLQKLLDKFIDQFVLCPKCHLPETVLAVRADKSIRHKCKACGAKHKIAEHKLNGYLLKMAEKAI